MAGILIKGSLAYEYERVVKGTSFIRLYNDKGFCFKQFANISDVGFSDFSIYKVTTDEAAVEGKTYYTRDGASFTTSAFVAGCYESDFYEVAPVAGFGAVTAECDSLSDDQILTLKLPAGIFAQDGLQITFKTPYANTEIYGIAIEGVTYRLVDNDCNIVQNYSSGFDAGDIVIIVLDMASETKYALVRTLNKFEIEAEVQEGSNKLVTSNAIYEHVKSAISGISSVSSYYTGTLTTSWSGSEAPYTQQVTIAGILDTDRPHVSPLYSSIKDVALSEQLAWNCISDVESAVDTLTFTCFNEKPETEINFQVEIIR